MVVVVQKVLRGEHARSVALLLVTLALSAGPVSPVAHAQPLDAPRDSAPAPAVQPAPSPGVTSTSTQPSSTPPSATTPPPRTQPTPTMAVASTSGPTETVVEDDPNAESGRADRLRIFYLEIAGGYSWVKLGLLRENNLVPDVVRLDESGFSVGGGLGFFISFVTLGVHVQAARHDSFDLGTVMLTAGIRLPTRHLEPYLRVGLGYAWLFKNDLIPGQSMNIRGVAASLGVGFDYMLTPAIAIGIGADATIFNVRRAGVSGAPLITSIDLSQEGDAVGLQVTTQLQLSFHF